MAFWFATVNKPCPHPRMRTQAGNAFLFPASTMLCYRSGEPICESLHVGRFLFSGIPKVSGDSFVSAGDEKNPTLDRRLNIAVIK